METERREVMEAGGQSAVTHSSLIALQLQLWILSKSAELLLKADACGTVSLRPAVTRSHAGDTLRVLQMNYNQDAGSYSLSPFTESLSLSLSCDVFGLLQVVPETFQGQMSSKSRQDRHQMPDHLSWPFNMKKKLLHPELLPLSLRLGACWMSQSGEVKERHTYNAEKQSGPNPVFPFWVIWRIARTSLNPPETPSSWPLWTQTTPGSLIQTPLILLHLSGTQPAASFFSFSLVLWQKLMTSWPNSKPPSAWRLLKMSPVRFQVPNLLEIPRGVGS